MAHTHAGDAKLAQCDRIVTGWRAMPLAEWVPVAHKPQVKHLKTIVLDRAVALGAAGQFTEDVPRNGSWKASKHIEWLWTHARPGRRAAGTTDQMGESPASDQIDDSTFTQRTSRRQSGDNAEHAGLYERPRERVAPRPWPRLAKPRAGPVERQSLPSQRIFRSVGSLPVLNLPLGGFVLRYCALSPFGSIVYSPAGVVSALDTFCVATR